MSDFHMTNGEEKKNKLAEKSKVNLVNTDLPGNSLIEAIEHDEFRGSLVATIKTFKEERLEDPPSMVFADAELVIEYSENAERQRWLGPLLKKIPLFLLLAFVILVFGVCTNTINDTFVFLGRTLLSPLKPVLAYDPGGAATSAIKFLTQVSWVFYAFLGWRFASLAMKDSERPTHIAISEESLLMLQFMSGERYSVTDAIYWPLVTNAKLVRPDGKRGVADYRLELTEDNGVKHSIRMGDVVRPNDRRRLIAAVNKYVNATAIDADSLEVFSEPEGRESYTELWLKELSAAPKRDKLTPLVRGNVLHDKEYSILSKIGMGGQGTVYLASKSSLIDPMTQAPLVVALKEFVLPVFPDVRVRKKAAEKFELEARVLSSLQHPNIVKFIDLFVEDHRAYLALERVDGVPLNQLVGEQGPIEPDHAIELALTACHILQYLHSQDPPVIHRDFTPDNLMVQSDGSLKLIDFSVAQQVESNITGTVVGKHIYMSPEQFRGKPTTQSDIYSLGATLHFVLTGQEPEAISSSHPKELNPNVPPALDAIVARATALDPTSRYASIAEMRKDLKDLKALKS